MIYLLRVTQKLVPTSVTSSDPMERHRDGGVEDSDLPFLRYEPTTDASCKEVISPEVLGGCVVPIHSAGEGERLEARHGRHSQLIGYSRARRCSPQPATHANDSFQAISMIFAWIMGLSLAAEFNQPAGSCILL